MSADPRQRLRAVAQNTYCVNEKVPPTYDRKWKLHVLWRDGSTSDYMGSDSAGPDPLYERALRDPRAADREDRER